jgi:hypothetical protein
MADGGVDTDDQIERLDQRGGVGEVAIPSVEAA